MGVVLQSCLYRTEKDFERVNALGARIRLVKGAYREPKSVAYQLKSDVDAAYVRLAKRLLTEGVYPAIATHDEDILNEVKRFASDRAISPDAYEFQMLYGIRRDLQNRFRDAGHRVRVYVPFGREWFPYFMRRLGERPANVGIRRSEPLRGTLDLDAEAQRRREFFRKRPLRLCASASRQAIRIVYLPSGRRYSGSARRAIADTRSTGRDDAPRDSE